MDERIFLPERMELKKVLLEIPIEKRTTYDAEQNILFVNFENLTIRSTNEIQNIRNLAEKILEPLNKRVNVILNYDNFDISPELFDEYMDMANIIKEKYYAEVTRYTTSTFMRMKLGESLSERGMPPHIYDCIVKAGATLKRNIEKQ